MHIATPSPDADKPAIAGAIFSRVAGEPKDRSQDPRLLIESLNELHAKADTATRTFFERLMQISPAAEIMHETAGQRAMLTRLLAATAAEATPIACAGWPMAESDPALEIEAEQVGAALLWTLEQVLEGFDRKLRSAWEHAYRTMMADLLAWSLAVEEAAAEMGVAAETTRPH